jgi:TonB family protein
VTVVTVVAPKIPARDLRAATPLGVAALRLGLAPSPLIALTRDSQLVAILKGVSDASHEVMPVGSEVDLSGMLLTHQGGVAVIDCAALANPIGELIDRLHAQFPELVLIVAGGSDEQGMLSTQITNGSVHRFLHRPFSEQRIRLFVEAAWRRHAQGGAVPKAEPRARAPRRSRAAPWLLLAALALAAPVAWHVWHAPPGAPASAPAPSAALPSDDSALESLLARADAALAAGALVAPPQENAAELYARALGRNARDPRAVNGLAQVIDRLLASAEQELQQQHLDAAEHLIEQARAIDANHARVAFLAAQVGAQRERAVLNKAQRAAAGGDIAGALATLEDASHGEHRSTLVEQARQQLAQKQLDGRIADYLGRARDALTRGALIAPVEDNARFYIESARALAPGDIRVQQATQELIAGLQNEARQALSAKNAEQADIWIAAAADAGAEPAQVGALRAEAQQLRSGARTAELAQLSGAFNERLERGQVLDPANDSARFYLTQLTQRGPDDPLTQRAHSAYAARLLDEARAALRGQDLAGTRRWLTEARGAGADASALGTLETALRAAQDDAQLAKSYVDAAALTRTHYLAPQFPDVARKRGLDGWVDLQFLVGTDGAVSDVAVVGAQPVGVFEQAALDAVRHWRYQPVLRAGQAVSQHARVRLRFTVQR